MTRPSTRVIEIVEVGPRDGLQNEKALGSTADKVALVERAIAAGIRRIEVASFVNPAKVPQMADAVPNPGALAGMRVIELGQLIAGPFCGQLLGDMGADVIKVEAPGKGDPMRDWGRSEHKLWWEVVARNKRSVSINLRVPNGQELVRKLAADADILIENFKPVTMEKWGLGPDVLHTLNPRLIIVRVSGYGQTGPYSARAGFGGIGEAMGGWRYIVGDPARAPSRMGISIGDTLAATYGCMGALAALRA